MRGSSLRSSDITATPVEIRRRARRIGISGEPVELVHELMQELDSDTRMDEGLSDPVISVEKVARLRRALSAIDVQPWKRASPTDARARPDDRSQGDVC